MSFKEKLKDFVKKYHYTKEEEDNKYADKTHTHTKSQITDLTIPTKTSDLTNDSGYLTSHHITQSITNGDTTHSPSGDAVYDALGGKSDTNHTHSAYVNPVIVDNLTTDDASKTLSAKQGKVLNDRIGDISTLINGTKG